MDPSEIVKAAPEIAKVVGPVAAAIPFTGIVKKMLGPAADELAKMWEDQIRLYRYERQMKCVEKAAKMAKDSGFTPKAVPPKILFPLLEGASFEDDEDLHTMWAALLANAASETGNRTRSGFIAILRQMAPDEAHLLKLIAALPDKYVKALQASGFVVDWNGSRRSIRDSENSAPLALDAQLDQVQMEHCLDFAANTDQSETAEEELRYEVCNRMLESAGLIEVLHVKSHRRPYILSVLGEMFLDACSPPKPKS